MNMELPPAARTDSDESRLASADGQKRSAQSEPLSLVGLNPQSGSPLKSGAGQEVAQSGPLPPFTVLPPHWLKDMGPALMWTPGTPAPVQNDAPSFNDRWPLRPESPFEAQLKTLPSSVCPVSPTYQALIKEAANRMYSPGLLGNIPDLLEKHTCDAMTPEMAMMRADIELHNTGDHYNKVLPPAGSAEKQDYIRGTVPGGIGARLESFVTVKPDPDHNIPGEFKTVVDQVPKGTPADKQKLERGDYIVKVDGTNTSLMNAAQIGELIRGAAGTKVDLTLIRNGQEIHRTLNREKIETKSVDKPIDKGDGIYYIRIREFNENTGRELQRAMASVSGTNGPAAKGFVIDLRNNTGGLMETSIKGSELFIRQGTILNGRERIPSDPDNPDWDHPKYALTRYSVNPTNELYASWPEGQEPSKPDATARLPYLLNGRQVTVLQNGFSASSSEIMIGALHDTAHAETVGEPSWGKGIYQLLDPEVAAGATVQVTQGIYKTPNYWWPGDAQGDRRPIKPDVEVHNPNYTLFNTANDAQLNEAMDRMRKKIADAAAVAVPLPKPNPFR